MIYFLLVGSRQWPYRRRCRENTTTFNLLWTWFRIESCC